MVPLVDVDTDVTTVVDEVVVGFTIVEGFAVVGGADVVRVVDGAVDFVLVRTAVVFVGVVCEEVVCWIVGEAVAWVVDDIKTESVLAKLMILLCCNYLKWSPTQEWTLKA